MRTRHRYSGCDNFLTNGISHQIFLGNITKIILRINKEEMQVTFHKLS